MVLASSSSDMEGEAAGCEVVTEVVASTCDPISEAWISAGCSLECGPSGDSGNDPFKGESSKGPVR